MNILALLAKDENLAPSFRAVLLSPDEEELDILKEEALAELAAREREDRDEVLREKQAGERERYGWASGE